MRRALLSPAPDAPDPLDADLAPQVVLRGRTEAVAVSEVLGFLAHLRKSGVLTVRTREENFTVYLLDGDVVHACSNNSPRDHLLGAILVRQGALGEGELEDFLQGFSRWKGRLGQALVRRGLVSEADLDRALETQVRALFERMTAASRATFTFSERNAPPSEARLRLSVVELLLESARQRDDAERRSPRAG